jgi:hypothetical protein
MVGVSKKYVPINDLKPTIEEMLKTYRKIRVDFPSSVKQHFLVKAWGKKTSSQR